MPITITQVITAEQIKNVANLASQIWQQHFTPIIGEAQVTYMLQHFQSVPAITVQISDGANYYLAHVDGQAVGYMCLISDATNPKLMLSKLYVIMGARGTGVGKALLDYAETLGRKAANTQLWLTVNRFNADAIAWYQRQAFVIVDEVQKPIGGGFVMDDFIMEKSLGRLE